MASHNRQYNNYANRHLSGKKWKNKLIITQRQSKQKFFFLNSLTESNLKLTETPTRKLSPVIAGLGLP